MKDIKLGESYLRVAFTVARFFNAHKRPLHPPKTDYSISALSKY